MEMYHLEVCSLRVGFWFLAEQLEYINMGTINHFNLNQSNRYDNDGTELAVFIPAVCFRVSMIFCGKMLSF